MKYIIESNSNNEIKYHDSILYPSIEKQVFDFFKNSDMFDKVEYFFKDREFFLFVDNLKLKVDIKNKVKISFQNCYFIEEFGVNNYISIGEHGHTYQNGVTINYNQDSEKKLKTFFKELKDLSNTYKKLRPYKKWLEEYSNEYQQKILDYLNSKFKDDLVDCSFFFRDYGFFTDVEIGFSIKPIGEAPADGVYLVFEKDKKTISPFWNNSTERRTNGKEESLENITSKIDFGKGVESMRREIAFLDSFIKKVKEFNSSDCPYIKTLLETKEEVNSIINKKENDEKSITTVA